MYSLTRICCIVFFISVLQCGHAQTLFTYGNRPVSKKEFLAAFNKNPGDPAAHRKALDDYLGLYINYKLKVQAAYDEKLDEQPSFKLESNNFKTQIAANLINEEAGLRILVTQAFERSRKDIRFAQVLVEFGKDTAAAYQQIQKAWATLQSGKDFSEVAAAFSTDADIRKSRGDMGYITVFTLQYEFENEIYALKPGSFSVPYKSKFAYHIFKNTGERPASGKRKISQILLPFTPDITETDKKRLSITADSIYQKIKSGIPFEELAAPYKNNSPVRENGLQPEIGVGEYSREFEEKVFSLQKPGDISAPFVTGYGYHIIKLEAVIPVGKDLSDPAVAGSFKQQAESSDRLAWLKRKNLGKWQQLTQYKKARFDTAALWQLTLNTLNGLGYYSPKINDSSLLFSFPQQKLLVRDWIRYVRSVSQNGNGFTIGAFEELLNDYIQKMCMDYYRDHLEEYNSNMRVQMKEFNEANLLFAAMDKHVWGKAGEDVTDLKKYYEQHKTKYTWQPGIAAILVTANGKKLATEVAGRLQQNSKEWRSIVTSYGVSVAADSGRYENGQLPVQQKIETRKGFVSTPERNNNDSLYTFLYVTEIFPVAGQRSFEEARGFVIGDYQQVLEDQWLGELNKKYPVKVNKEVWKTIK